MLTLRDKATQLLASWVPEILARQDEHGVFWPDHGRPVRFNTDFQQYGYYPLAYLFVTRHSLNPYAGDERLLKAAERSLRNNVAIHDETGQMMMSSHDLAPFLRTGEWRNFTWLQTLDLLRPHLDPSLVEQCEQSLRRAKDAIAAIAHENAGADDFCIGHNVWNHPMWVFLTTYIMACHFDDTGLRDWIAETFERIAGAQHPAGLWYEGNAPVTVYQHVTVAALSHFHHLTGSSSARKALERALGFHRLMTYPNGHPIETIDGRTWYTGFTMSILPAAWAQMPQGAAYLHFLLDKLSAQPMGKGYHIHSTWFGLPFVTQFIRDLPASGAPVAPVSRPGSVRTQESPATVSDGIHSLASLPVRVIRLAPWTVVLSAITRPEAPGQRWLLDLQSHLSIFHDRAGLIIGGGGGKRQAALSLFHGGSRPLGLPSLATGGTVETLSPTSARLTLRYDSFAAQLQVLVSEHDVKLIATATGVEGIHLQLQFPMKGDAPITTASARTWPADAQDEIVAEQAGNRLGRQGLFAITGFEGARALLFILPYNTHWKNGWSPDERAVGVVAQPLAKDTPRDLHIHAR